MRRRLTIHPSTIDTSKRKRESEREREKREGLKPKKRMSKVIVQVVNTNRFFSLSFPLSRTRVACTVGMGPVQVGKRMDRCRTAQRNKKKHTKKSSFTRIFDDFLLLLFWQVDCKDDLKKYSLPLACSLSLSLSLSGFHRWPIMMKRNKSTVARMLMLWEP